jgi:hypothetical protein
LNINITSANRRHAIIAGFSLPEVWFSRRKFIFSGENSVRFAATSHGGKPLPANVSHFLRNHVL